MTRDAESAVKNQLEKIEHVAEVDSVANVDMRVSLQPQQQQDFYKRQQRD